MTPTVPVSLVDALRQYRILDAVQLEEVTRCLPTRFPDQEALAAELVRWGWLTAYQARLLLQGRGQELLLGSYILLERLGEGGMGQVFKARSGPGGRIQAVKLIRKELLDNADAVRRFEREVRAATALSHPNIVHALGADRAGGTHLLVMEYVEGTDLAKLVKRQGPLPVPRACDYVRQVALGLQHAFERGLVHRDVKPANLLLTKDGATVKILDLGLARLDHPSADDASTMTQEGVFLGTPDYIAPEQALESHTVDTRGDLYSLGCTFYYLLTGRVPFPAGSLLQKLNRHQNEYPPPVEALRSDVPAEVTRIVRTLMAKRPEQRYQTPAELTSALASVAPEAGTLADEDVTVLLAPQRPRGRAGGVRRPRPGVVGCTLLAAAISTLWFLLPPPAGRKPSPSHVLPNGAPRAKEREAWLKEVAAMPSKKQVEAVAAKLQECNPDFDGRLSHKIDNGVVTELELVTDRVTDLSPVRALTGLQKLHCAGTARGKGRLADLSPLEGMNLTCLVCSKNRVSDLSPLRGMPLKELNLWYTPVSDLAPLRTMRLVILGCGDTRVSDLSPLRGMQLWELNIWGTPVSDLSPLKGMALTTLVCGGTRVSDLSPLEGMRLKRLVCDHTRVSDLSPLRNMKLTRLDCEETQVSDLSPLKGMPLESLWCDFQAEQDTAILRSIKTLEKINGKPAAEFWRGMEKRPDKKPDPGAVPRRGGDQDPDAPAKGEAHQAGHRLPQGLLVMVDGAGWCTAARRHGVPSCQPLLEHERLHEGADGKFARHGKPGGAERAHPRSSAQEMKRGQAEAGEVAPVA